MIYYFHNWIENISFPDLWKCLILTVKGMSAQEKALRYPFLTDEFCVFLSEGGNDLSHEGENGWKIDFFPARVGISNFDVVFCKSTFPELYLDLAYKKFNFLSKKL